MGKKFDRNGKLNDGYEKKKRHVAFVCCGRSDYGRTECMQKEIAEA